ncbi:TnsD family Tn7-like transposition protein [Pseudomonas typographi]|uniref:TnsD family Tn7-like transposition protein n=1 Tax=Pseudomonas typographi TaxID=2715964 RepID=UPI0016884EC5|nr:TnsD family Tn7-like transposition protein [Pseudomonas typographi]MBD1553155.1 transposase [Pseudomonas typographi]
MEPQFHFFPAAFPDETLHSVLSRYARLFGGGSSKAAFAGSGGAASFTQNVSFPCRLGDLVESLPSGVDLSVNDIIERHTVLPYYAPFLTNEQLQHAKASITGVGKGLMLKLGVNASRIEGTSRVRFCPMCLSEDIDVVGAAYWHRVHQLPGVLICPHHGQLLKVVDPRWYSRNSRQLNLPDDDGVQAHAIQINVAAHTLPGLRQIALSSLQVLTLGCGPLPASAVRACLLQGATVLGLASSSTWRLDLGRLAAHMASYFHKLPAAWEYSVLCESPPGLPATWVTKLLRRPRGTHHPLKYIVLASALEVDLTCTSLIDSPSFSVVKHRPLPSTVCTSQRGLTKPVPGADGLENLPTAVWRLACAGQQAQQIAGTLGVSQVYVYRTIRAVDGGSSAWSDAKFLSERLRRRAAFEADYQLLEAHRCRSYGWLYRCDRAWLSDHLAMHGTFHRGRAIVTATFAALDARLAVLIRDCAQRLHALPGKPIRISRTRIARELHVLSRFEKQLSKLPLCAKGLDEACESIGQFHVRRLQWATVKLESEQKRVTRSALYRTACIRPGK